MQDLGRDRSSLGRGETLRPYSMKGHMVGCNICIFECNYLHIFVFCGNIFIYRLNNSIHVLHLFSAICVMIIEYPSIHVFLEIYQRDKSEKNLIKKIYYQERTKSYHSHRHRPFSRLSTHRFCTFFDQI